MVLCPGEQDVPYHFKDGMRYDFGFNFEYADNCELKLEEPDENISENDSWPMANINRFWFVQIQALGKEME